jgi:hypothetical protein
LGVAAFFGVAFFVAVFLGAAAFLVVLGAVCLVLVTRPDFVLVSTLGTSTIAGAYGQVSILLRQPEAKTSTAVGCLAVFFALGLAVLAFGLAAGVFLGAGAFLVAAGLVVVVVVLFFGAGFLVVAVGESAFGLASLGSFCMIVSNDEKNQPVRLITNLWGSCFGGGWLGLFLCQLDWSRWSYKHARQFRTKVEAQDSGTRE